MYASFSLQNVKDIKASAYTDLASTPLLLNFETAERDSFSRAEIVLHLEDAALAAALVDAINSTIAKHAAEKQPEAEAA